MTSALLIIYNQRVNSTRLVFIDEQDIVSYHSAGSG